MSLDVHIDTDRMVLSRCRPHEHEVRLMRSVTAAGHVAAAAAENENDEEDADADTAPAAGESTVWYVCNRALYAYAIPRLLVLQSPERHSGKLFRRARALLRVFSMTLLVVFATMVGGILIQASFPHLRSIPIRVQMPADRSFITINHVVVHMHIFTHGKGEAANAARVPPDGAYWTANMTTDAPVGQGADAHRGGRSNSSNSSSRSIWFAEKGWSEGGRKQRRRHGRSGADEPRPPQLSDVAFKWNNVTSSAHEDFYPPLCQRVYHGVTLWELSLLALLPYLFDMDEVNMLLTFMNTHLGSDWTIRPRYGDTCVSCDSERTPTRWTGFHDVYSAQYNTSVIAVRGTDMFSFADLLTDVNLYFETFLYRVIAALVPGATMLPKDMVSDLIRAASLPSGESGVPRETWAELVRSRNRSRRCCHANNYGRHFFADVYNHLMHVALQQDVSQRPAHVVLTGHSLGGTVAGIVGATMDVEAVMFCSPGLLLSRKKFNLRTRSIHKRVLTVVTTNDVVPAFGEHGGELQHVECLASTPELCHAIEFLIGTLWRSCGTVRDRFPVIKDVV